MRRLRAWLLRFAAIFGRRRRDLELADELESHLQMHIDENRRAGMTPEEARRQALIQLGGVDQTKESYRDRRGVPSLESLLQDVRFGLRMLRKNPGFTAVAILTLALGIGANTAIFSLTDQVLLRSLPVRNPRQLVELVSPGPEHGHTWSDGIQGSSFSYPMFEDLRGTLGQSFSGVLATYPVTVDVSGLAAPERVAGELVSGNYFDVLGVAPALGRVFSMYDETAAGGNPVVVLTYGFWQRRFGSDPGVLNRVLDANGTSLTIVGVARKGYQGIQIGSAPDVFIPITMKDQMAPGKRTLADREDHWVQVLGRLRPGLTRERAEAAAAPTYRALLESEVSLYKFSSQEAVRFDAKPLLLIPASQGRPIVQLSARQPLLIMTVLVGLALLVACANLASLLAARGEARQREIAVRMALGAERRRLVRQLLTEGFVLSLAGAVCGLLLAVWTMHFLLAALRDGKELLDLQSRPDYPVLLFALGVSMVTTLLFALAPALRSTRVDPHGSLKQHGARATGGAESARMREVLTIAQLTLTVALLTGAGLLVRTLVNLENANLGMKVSHVQQFSLSPDSNGYTPQQTALLFDRLRAAIARIPGVRSVAVAMLPVFHDTDASTDITAQGYIAKPGEDTDCQWNQISPGYFSAMGIPLLSGREFTDADTPASPSTVVINERLAQRFFAGRNPIGLHLSVGSGGEASQPAFEIVGVVANSRHDGVRDRISPFMYFPYSQGASGNAFVRLGFGTFYVRTEQDPAIANGEIRQMIESVDPRLAIYNVRTLGEQVNASMFQERALAFLSISLGLLAALLAVIGLYGLLAYSVARRTREIGIRMALGAQPGEILAIVFREGGKVAIVGIILGLVASVGLTRILEATLFGVSPTDPLTFAVVVSILVSVTFFACWIPARRAMRVDPMVALRYE
ncbi:MAG TPA: ABC transporter permease [Candidatus Aquilonibacter sp.]|nr:ABC transporter permease [Candidatus Aquilonibacter sp.]